MATSDKYLGKTTEELTKVRANFKGTVTALKNFAQTADPRTTTKEVVMFKIKRLEMTCSKFDEVQEALESLDSTKFTYTDTEAFELAYCDALNDASALISEIEKVTPSTPTTNSSFRRQSSTERSPHHNKALLPKIALSKFSGEQDEWLAFKELFDSLVDKDTSLSALQKHHYLRASLIGAAARMLESLPITAENYNNAIELLCDRYDNPRVTIEQHVECLFNLEPVKYENGPALRDLLDKAVRQCRALEAAGVQVQYWDPVLLYLISTKLDPNTLRAWETESKDVKQPKFNHMIDFLSSRSRILCKVPRLTTRKPLAPKPPVYAPARAHAVSAKGKCTMCQEDHRLYLCPQFRKLPVEERKDFITKNKLCFNCFGFHLVSKCYSHFTCHICKEKHHTFLHQPSKTDKANFSPKREPEPDIDESEETEPMTSNAQSMCHNASTVTGRQVLLSTAVAFVKDHLGNWVKVRCLLDSAATHCFASKALAHKLKLPKTKTEVTVTGINQQCTEAVNFLHLKLTDRLTKTYRINLNCLVIDRIGADIPSASYNVEHWKINPNLQLADPDFNVKAQVDVLLSADVFWSVLKERKLNVNRGVWARETKLGWILTGRIQSSNFPEKASCNLTNVELHKTIEKFWNIEDGTLDTPPSAEDLFCEQQYVKDVTRDHSGRFIVKMPRQIDHSPIDNMKNLATRRLITTEKRFQVQPEIKTQYVEFMNEYEGLNHMEIVPKREEFSTEETVYLSHHPVWKNSEVKDKIRVVFNGSCKDSKGVTLNDTLLTGPKIQTNLFSSLINFRLKAVAVTADIEKMYRQILIHPEQRNLQRIVWRPSEDRPLRNYRLRTVTYGLKPSSFLAIRTLKELALQDGDNYSTSVKKSLLENFYVDDYLQSFHTEGEALKHTNQLKNLLSGGGFPLKKWCTNSEALLNRYPKEERAVEPPELFKDDITVKTLGLHWQPSTDTLGFKVQLQPHKKLTKRNILSEIASIYDPLHYISPVIVTAKLFMQQLWTLSTGWDDLVPTELQTSWLLYRQSLPNLNNLYIPRKLCDSVQIRKGALHFFCDSSEKAYGCAAYLTASDHNLKSSSLICSKSRVAPLKKISLPRLELCSALLAAELKETILKDIQIPITEIHFWSDSTITLAWISKQPSSWHTFIANRVTKIQAVTLPQNWHYVPGIENPADLISRGCSPSTLSESHLYWNGPKWLNENESCWPKQPPILSTSVEEKRTATILTANTDEPPFYYKYSSYPKLIRITAYLLRWWQRIVNGETTEDQTISLKEWEYAELTILKLVQYEDFKEEIKTLKRGRELSKKNRLLSLNPFVDKKGLLRVGGRLQSSSAEYNKQHPIILPRKHAITRNIIRHIHNSNMHTGARTLLYLVRQRFWPIAGLHEVNSVIHCCVICKKAAPKPMEQKMGNLPAVRVTPARPFSATGTDFCGPFPLRAGKCKWPNEKGYVCVFVCMVTGAIHLEATTGLSTPHFFAAFARFCCRRGKPTHVYSDNGTNFVATNNDLREISETPPSKEEALHYADQEGITWHFIPPFSPAKGGKWESAVKQFKTHFKKVASNTVLKLEELITFMTYAEGILNSRPITPMSNDPNDLMPLTPGHFLIGTAINAPPICSRKTALANLQIHYKKLLELQKQFWDRWSAEYLTQLHLRSKGRNNTPNLEPGDMVLLKNGCPPYVWHTARVLEVYPAKDKLVRVVKVLTKSGTYTRPITMLCKLPIENQKVILPD